MTAIDADAAGGITGGLAARWRFEASATRIRFTLRAGLRDSVGRPITSIVVRRWLERLALPTTASPHAFILGYVEGFAAVAAGATSRLAGITTPDERTIVFQLDRPFSSFPVLLAHPAAGIVPGTGDDFGPKRPSSGPFVLTEAAIGSHVSLRRNERSNGASALLAELQIRVVDDAARAIRAGTIDVGTLRGGESDAGARVATIWATLSLGVNVATIPGLSARRALRLAIDPSELADVGRGGLPAAGLVPPDLLEPPASPASDADLARTRWAGAPKKPRAPLRFVHLDDEQSTAFAAILIGQLRTAGIPVVDHAVDPASYPTILGARRFDLIQLAWLAEMPTPDGFLAGQLGSTSIDNKTGWKDAAFDAAITRARRATGPADRAAAYAVAHKRALDQVAQIPFLHLQVRYLADDRIQGLELDGSGSFDPATVWFLPGA